MVDKSIDNSPRIATKSTQYQRQNTPTPPTKKGETLKVKLTKRKSRDAGTNTELSFSPFSLVSFTIDSENSRDEGKLDDETADEEEIDDMEKDPNFEPESESQSENEMCEEIVEEGKQYFVFWSCLKTLFRTCSDRFCKAYITKTFFRGSMLCVEIFCANGHLTKWQSQPTMRGMATGNLLLSASILYSGNTFSRVKEMLDIANIAFISATTYNEIQKCYLFPSIHHVYTTNREIIFGNVRDEGAVQLSGDGRCDSPGYSAKFGTYTLMNTANNQILDFTVTHCNIAGNSVRMELHGLKELIQRLNENGVEISSLTTDRHTQVRKYMREEQPQISHQFDIWHVSKGLKKKLFKAAKKKSGEEIMPWIKSIINHFWWCCATSIGNPDLMKEKWLSILHHITNRHSWESCKHFNKCDHPALSKDEQRTKPWMKLERSSFRALKEIIASNNLIKDLKYLSDFNHTGTLEIYHSLYNKYCPKRLSFSYEGMVARSQLAVMDHNSSIGLQQDITKRGEKRFKLVFSRITQTWVTKPIKEKKDKTYLKYLVEEAFYQRVSGEKYSVASLPKPPQNIAPFEKPPKKEAIAAHRSRFLEK